MKKKEMGTCMNVENKKKMVLRDLLMFFFFFALWTQRSYNNNKRIRRTRGLRRIIYIYKVKNITRF